MKTLYTAVALSTAIALPAFAQDYDNLIRTRDITGGTIYSVSAAYDETSWGADPYYNSVDANWRDIGEIEDVVLDRNGQMIGIVGEIGGFLDIGDKHVLLPVENLKLVAVDDEEYAYVTRMTEEQLEEFPSVDEGWWD